MPAHDLRAPRVADASPMTVGERATWVSVAVIAATTAGYVAVVVPRALREPVAEVAWVGPTPWTIGASMVGNAVGVILAPVGSAVGLAARSRSPETELGSDARDRAIDRPGIRPGYLIVGAGPLAVLALALALLDADAFWIGNAAYAAAAIASAVEAEVRIRAYRRDL